MVIKNKEGQMNLGYACINMQLSYPQQYGGQPKGVGRITTGRKMIKRTFEAKGTDLASELILKNVRDLDKIVDWNIAKGYKLFRISSTMIPWKKEYDWSDLKDLEEIKQWLHSAGTKANTHGLRLTTHPGQFNVLTSPHEHVVQNCINDLTIHGEVFDMMGLSRTPYNKINIHAGGVYGEKENAIERFVKNFQRLPESVQTRLTVENDDKATCYSTQELYDFVYKRIGIPIVFDYHHHRFCPGDLSERAAVELAASTWPEGITPCFHYSESRSEEKEDPKIRAQAHSDYVYQKIETYGHELDIVVEAKHKELAVERYYQIHG